jgi:predicted phage baseplate assembly protein
MPLVAPDLDDRRYDDLLAEARSLIPRYAPEWTNHNRSDPGITLLELFAWFTDLLVYRVNQVPDRHYVKFLELLGIQTDPATPARADLTFTVAPTTDHVDVPAGMQVSAPSSDGKPVVFELQEAFTAIGAPLANVQVYDAMTFRDVTNANTTGDQTLQPFGAHARLGSALYLGFDAPAGMTTSTITLMVEAKVPPRSVAEVGAIEAAPPAELAYEFFDGERWSPLGVERDETIALTVSGRLVMFGPGVQSAASVVGQVPDPRHWLRLRLDQGSYDRVPELDRVVTNTVPALQAVTIRNEVLGGSDGLPNQGPFPLASTPVLLLDTPRRVVPPDGSIVEVSSALIEVDEGSGFVAWQEVDGFSSSGPEDRHYTLDRTTGEVRFGDGRRGAIPTANPALPTANIVARTYLAGGGARGNVGAGVIANLQSAVTGVKGVTNAHASAGGADEETVEEAKLRAPAELKAKLRAVTSDDFETLAMAAPTNVARAHALPRVHPAFPDAEVPGAVTVLIVPDAPGPAPVPAPATVDTVCRWLDTHRLVTTEVFVAAPTYRRVQVEVDVVVRAGGDLAGTRAQVAEALTGFLHPLTGGKDGVGWEFGGTIFASDLYRIILDIEDVERIRDNQLEVVLDGERQPFCRDVELRPGELVDALAPDVTASYQ